jgi:16S rRNA (cytidine1402-2'-O)-methyltransferase
MSARRPAPGLAPEARSFAIGSHQLDAPRLPGGLYLVATPIGNLGDITLRALQTLAAADLIACEDTRITRRLAERYGLRAALTAYHEHNADAARPKLLAALAQGQTLALVSDAGTPLISDPGYRLVREVTAAGYPVTALPGPSSVLAALCVAGLPTDRFFFEGFLPPKQAARQTRIAELSRVDATLVLFETGPRIAAALRDLAGGLGDREAAICRELTKLHEEVRRGPLPVLAQDADALETRGEFVVVIGPPTEDADAISADDLDVMLREALAARSLRDAVDAVSELSRRPRREVYARALILSKAPRDAEA